MPPKVKNTKTKTSIKSTNGGGVTNSMPIPLEGNKLLIVESPGKIAKIKSFLPSNYQVAASVGHIRDLHSTKEYRLGVDIDGEFAPHFAIDKGKEAVIAKLRGLQKGRFVILAADEDREGEAIAESLRDILKLGTDNYARVGFNEISKQAILESLKHPRKINYHIYDAQLTRRILDRIVGFLVSPLLNKVFAGNHTLGAGRVQAPVLRLVVEQERKIKDILARPPLSSYEGEVFLTIQTNLDMEPHLVQATLRPPSVPASANATVTATAKKKKAAVGASAAADVSENGDPDEKENNSVANLEQAREVLKQLLADTWTLTTVKYNDSVSTPPAPFITSTLGQEAHTVLGFSMQQTMRLAQQLYEAGLITYMRTDSPSLSQSALEMCRDYIQEQFGEQSYQHRQFQSSKASSQEAHEAVRPVDLNKTEAELENNAANRLYNLIWRRTVASQMNQARYANLTLTILGTSTGWSATGTIKLLTDKGYLQVKNPKLEVQLTLEQLEVFKNIKVETLRNLDRWSLDKIVFSPTIPSIPNRFNESTMIKTLEKMEIGRPSTYATIIKRVQDHGYLTVADVPGVQRTLTTLSGSYPEKSINESTETKELYRQKGRFIPTPIGEQVNDLLIQHFTQLMNYEFTKKMEANLDEIANGSIGRIMVLTQFWNEFSNELAIFRGYVDRQPQAQAAGEERWRPIFVLSCDIDSSGAKDYQVTIGQSKFGQCLRISVKGDGNGIEATKTRQEAAKKSDRFIDWKLTEPPTELEVRQLLQEKGGTLIGPYRVFEGKYGKYFQDEKDQKISVPSELELTPESLDNLVKQKNSKILTQFEKYSIRQGPYGAYILVPGKTPKDKPKFVNIPQTKGCEDPSKLTLIQVEEIIKQSKLKPKAKATVTETTDKLKPKPNPKPKTKPKAKS